MSTHRSDEFDEITMGWSQDNADDIEARIQLATERCTKNTEGIPTLAEEQILTAMRKALASYRGG